MRKEDSFLLFRIVEKHYWCFFVLRQALLCVVQAGLQLLILTPQPLRAVFTGKYYHTWLGTLFNLALSRIHSTRP